MARGWESKSVESQQGEQRAAKGKKSQEDMDRDHRRHSLEMSRRRIENELSSTKSAMRRQSLEAALKHLDAELAKLQG
ncbi:MAG TPA: hypothetical protein VKU62_06310 [Thermoanaerobaculia bacterium]|nr:hypothetical protein [Thermoanaerobaculia bacterium]